MWDKIFMFPVIEKLLWVVVVVIGATATFSFCIYCLLENILLHKHKGSHSITFTLYTSMHWILFFALFIAVISPIFSFDISWRYCYCLPFSHSMLLLLLEFNQAFCIFILCFCFHSRRVYINIVNTFIYDRTLECRFCYLKRERERG